MSIADMIIRIRFLLGSLETEIVSDEVLTLIITQCQADTANDTDCKVMFCTIIETLHFLIRRSFKSEGDVASGALKRLREEEGLVEYETEYYNTISDNNNGWEKLLEYFEGRPEAVCPELSESMEAPAYHIGGVSRSGVRAIEENSDSNGTRVGIGYYDDVGRVGRIVNAFGLTREEAERRRIRRY